MTLRFHELSPDVRATLESMCARRGFVPEDFEFEIADAPASGQIAERIVTVERVIGGHFKQYNDKTGGDASWLAAFEADLAMDWFGAPLAD